MYPDMATMQRITPRRHLLVTAIDEGSSVEAAALRSRWKS
jgi:hypothetical protein